jgi:perosamine synthetase
VTGRRIIPIAAPSVGDDEWEALRQPIQSGWLTQGAKVREFEEAFAARHRVPHAVATTSCTTALHVALTVLDIGPGDEVIVPSFTWIATANAVLYCGAIPVFVDVRADTYNVDPAMVADAVSPRTRAAIPVHLFGLCADVDTVRTALPDGVHVVEDAACAAGAAYRGTPAGGLGDAACFSFHPRKSVTTGEGGMVTTVHDHVAERAYRLRNHGAATAEEARHAGPAPYLLPAFDELGYNYRMTDLQGAMGVVQLAKLDRFVAERDHWARWYDDQLSDIEWLNTPEVPDGYQHAWQSYCTLVRDDAPIPRNEIMRRLHELGIGTRAGTHAVPDLGYYRKHLGISPGRFPVAKRLQEQTLAIPLHNRMSAEDYAHVVEAIHAL